MNTIKTTKKILAGVILASSTIFAAGASAAVITAFDFTSDGGFVNTGDGTMNAATCSNGGGAQDACNIGFSNAGVTPSGIADTSDIITWGTPSTISGNGNQSGLQAIFGTTGGGPYNAALLGSGPVPIPMFEQIITNGGWTNTGAAVHYNNVITIPGGALASTVVRTTFQLLTPGPGPVAPAQLDIGFNETSNLNAACPGGNPHGTICDDIFTLTGNLDPITFSIDGQLYRLSFRFADGPGAIVIGNTIYTAENSPGTAVVFVQAQIETVPLPGVLALMGLGFMMLSLQVRGRRRKLV